MLVVWHMGEPIPRSPFPVTASSPGFLSTGPIPRRERDLTFLRLPGGRGVSHPAPLSRLPRCRTAVLLACPSGLLAVLTLQARRSTCASC